MIFTKNYCKARPFLVSISHTDVGPPGGQGYNEQIDKRLKGAEMNDVMSKKIDVALLAITCGALALALNWLFISTVGYINLPGVLPMLLVEFAEVVIAFLFTYLVVSKMSTTGKLGAMIASVIAFIAIFVFFVVLRV